VRAIVFTPQAVNIPSFQVKVGDTVAVKEKSRDLKAILESLESQSLSRPEWLDVNKDQKNTKVRDLPGREAVPFAIDLQQVVEYYAKRM